ncbi:MAG: PAS domain S-box protein [bacterium]
MEELKKRDKPKISDLLDGVGKNKKALRDGSPLSGHLLFRRLGAIAIPVLIVAIAILAILDIRVVFEPPLLLPLLNTVFISIVSFAVAYISARCYLSTGLPNILLLGCGVLGFGTGNLVSGWLITFPGAPNINVTIHNTGALFGSLFHAVSAMLPLPEITAEKVSKHRKIQVILAYLGVLVFVALLAIASLQDVLPPFFIQGVGPTPLRQGVLGIALALFAISSIVFIKRYFKLKVGFLYWYSLALALITVGLSAVFLQTVVGSPIGWVGRSAQYLSGIYFFIAVLAAIRGARVKGISLELELFDFFREAGEHYRVLIETVSDAIVSVNYESRVLLWNSAAEKMFGYSRGEAVGSLLIDLIVADQYAHSLREDFSKVDKNPLIGKTTEIEARKKDGEVFPAELSVSSRKIKSGWISTIIMRDITERKKAEEALKESERRFKAIFEHATDGILVADPETKKLYNANQEMCRMLGYSLSEIKNLTVMDVHHQEDAPFAIEQFEKLVREEITQTADIPMKRKDGSIFYASVNAYPIIIAETKYLIGIFRDITERKKAEEALRKSEEKYRQLIENLQEGIWAIDKDSNTTFVNPRMAEMLGYTTDEMIGKHLFSFMDERSVEIAQRLLKRRESGIGEQHDFEFVRKDGTRLYVTLETTPIFDSKRNYMGAIAGVMDISRRKQAENALRLSEERYALAQRVANIGSWDWDIRTGNLKWSEKIEPMFGFGRGEFAGTYEAFLECVHPEDRQYVVDSVNACIEKGRDYDIEHRIVWPDGRIRWVSETGNVIRDENNKAIRMLGIVRDITERKRAEEVLKRDKETFERLVNERTKELFKAQAELDKAKRLSDLGTLAATVAHELRNPLGVIKTASYNIRRKRQNALVDKHLDNIEKKIWESEQIINNLLGYSRIKIPSYEKIKIYDVLNECITFTKRRFYKQNVSVVKKFLSPKKKFIKADPLQIREIVNNILTNAYQSITNKKGKIEIEAKDDRNGFFEISFKDNGIGIDKEDLGRIFEPFFTRKSKGTGLGLTICNELVNLHGGKIDIESEKGKGTTVTISLPIKRETE